MCRDRIFLVDYGPPSTSNPGPNFITTTGECQSISAPPPTSLPQLPLQARVTQVMACPSGCLNGGGQIKAAAQREEESNRDLLRRVTDRHHFLVCAS